MANTSSKDRNDRLHETILADLHEMDFRKSLRQDLQGVYEYYLDQDERNELAEMGRLSRWFHMVGWLLKAIMLRLSPLRRLLFLVSVMLFLTGLAGDAFWLGVGFLVTMLILLLELKDKALAQEELQTGRLVQFALMPREDPTLPGWETWLFTRPAREVGGDLVDYLELQEDRLSLSLGDVSGKGLGAALHMAHLQSTLRALAPRAQSLAELGAELNTIIRRDGTPGRFMSLVYMELAPNDDAVRLINTGHMPPIVIQHSGLAELSKGAAALGLLTDLSVTEQTVNLQPGELMVVYSDGLTEARSEDGEFFGRHRLLEILTTLRGIPAEDAGRCLLDAHEEFVGEAEPSDDLSMVVVRRMPRLEIGP